MPTSIPFFPDYLSLRIRTMVASQLKLMFFIILPLQLSATLSQENKHEMNGVAMTLHMKMRMKSRSLTKITVEEPLYYPSDFAEYYIKLSVGTPAQDVLLVMDTGSNVVWVPCTRNYICNQCPEYSTVFLPRKSSSHVPVKCADPKCRDLCDNEGCIESFQKCSRICPHFKLTYGTGNATGRLLSDTLTLPLEDGGSREIKRFAIGCSVVSFGVAGIAGFARGGLSMPSQLAPLIGDKFAYCLDYRSNSSKIVLGNKAVPRDLPLTYTPLLFNPVDPLFFSQYYLDHQAVSIGGKRLTLPSNLLSFDSQGNGGTIIDSGSDNTIFPEPIYNQTLDAFASQIGYRRSPIDEAHSELGLCYNVSGLKNIRWPKFVFHFKGGSDMVLPEENSFTAVSSSAVCLAVDYVGSAASGPAVIIGNIQQNNFYILYDKEKNRLGFIKRPCKTFGRVIDGTLYIFSIVYYLLLNHMFFVLYWASSLYALYRLNKYYCWMSSCVHSTN